MRNRAPSEIAGLTMAVFDMDKMLSFYSTLLNIEFQKDEKFDGPLYIGRLGNLELVLCPADIAGCTATQNRHQLEIVVPDLGNVIGRVHGLGGELMGDITESIASRIAAVYDPDRNSLVLKQFL